MTDFDTISNKNIVGMALGDMASGCGSGTAGARFMRDGDLYAMDEHYGQSINNNNFPFELSIPSTSHCNTETVQEDDEDSSILSNLPTSCHEFEIKEMHIRLERNASSPLVGGKASPCTSIGTHSGCPSAEPPVDLTEPEDLEVQMINETFEEQQKQNQLYTSGDLKSLFYHGSSDEAGSSKADCSSAGRERRTNSKDGERLPFTKNLRSLDTGDELPTCNTLEMEPSPHPVTPPYRPNLFQPLLTPKSEALFSQRLSIGGPMSFIPPVDRPNKRRVSEPCSARGLWGRSPHGHVGHDTSGGGHSRHVSFDNTVFEMPESLPGTPSPPMLDVVASFPQAKPAPPAPATFLRPDNLCEQTECLATEVVESLFTPQQKPSDLIPSDIGPSVRKCSRRLNMDTVGRRTSSTDSQELPTDIPPIESTLWKDDPPLRMGTPTGKLIDLSDCEDSWETLDDQALDKQMSQLKLEATKKQKASSASSSSSSRPRKVITVTDVVKPAFFEGLPTPQWDPKFLPHVLEAYPIPPQHSAKEVKTALAEIGYDNADVKMSGLDCALIIFAGARQAMDAQVLSKHPWLKLRSLSVAKRESQDAARRLAPELTPRSDRPRTSGATARRMVENALGVKSTVSTEQRTVERKQLNAAKAAKKERDAVWE